MDVQDLVGQNEVLSNMTAGRPVKSYKKVILGKILLKVWDTMTNTQRELVFGGDPRKGEEAVFDVFSEKEKLYFERMNQRHFAVGNLVEYKRALPAEPEKTFEQYSDAELTTIVNSRWLALISTLNKIDSIQVLFRLKTIAQDLEKSEKVVNAINGRMAELQIEEVSTKSKQTEEESLETEEE